MSASCPSSFLILKGFPRIAVYVLGNLNTASIARVGVSHMMFYPIMFRPKQYARDNQAVPSWGDSCIKEWLIGSPAPAGEEVMSRPHPFHSFHCSRVPTMSISWMALCEIHLAWGQCEEAFPISGTNQFYKCVDGCHSKYQWRIPVVARIYQGYPREPIPDHLTIQWDCVSCP